jgi:hypothetical protein
MPTQNDLSTEELLRWRLFNQRISIHKEKTPATLIRHMGAMQAQDYPMAKWALGTRLSGSKESSVHSAVSRGSIIRTHVLRPTWHFVSPENLSWMLSLTTPRLHASSKARLKQLGITPAIIKKSNRLLVSLLKGRSVNRQEIMDAYTREKINTSEYRGGHLLFEAELEALICSGRSEDANHTYALIADRIPPAKTHSKSEALKKLGKMYFQGHGPASLADFTWWSGLSPVDARHALELQSNLDTFNHDGQVLYAFKKQGVGHQLQGSAYLLPAYDEYTIAYKDRSAMTDKRFLKKTISTNGIFYPLVVLDGKISGLWKKQQEKERLVITIQQFSSITTSQRELLSLRARELEHFYGKKTVLRFGK